jgi:hypothetical protein
MSDSREKRDKGLQILENFKKQVINRPELKDTFNESIHEGSIFMHGLDYHKTGQ